MIKINDKEIVIEHFPDGTQRLNCFPNVHKISDISFLWKYESDEELVTLIYLVEHLRNNNFLGQFILYLEFVPNGRMDRVHYEDEVFTLKYFCNIINSLEFSNVVILDPHSNVTPALLNNVIVNYPIEYIKTVLKLIREDSKTDVILYFPDYSAMKKYSQMTGKTPFVYGSKKRDWSTGKILGIDIVNEMNLDLSRKTILMVDDLISYGGSMKYGADKLKELGVNKIYAYATHTENSVLDHEKGTLIKSLENGTVERLFTTNSLFTGKHDKITVLEEV